MKLINKPIAIIAGEPNSISSEIIFKAWKKRKKYIHKPFIVIGNMNLLNLQKKKLKYKFKIKKITQDFNLKTVSSNELCVYNIDFNQKKTFGDISEKSSKYIFNCFSSARRLIKNNKVIGLINCPVSKESLFKKKHQGITEFLSKKDGILGNEVMLIYNKKLSVSPLTTHIAIKDVSKNIIKSKIIKKIKIINNFYKKIFNKKPHFAVLGLNPHNFKTTSRTDKTKIIYGAIKSLRRLKIKVSGPISPDTSFVSYKKKKFDIIFGMYHDQVLTPFKALFDYNAINITLGLPYIRVSPDHGVGENILGKNIANPKSLIEAIKFFNYLK